jgi:ParB family chromosome partitioning protein
MNITLLPIEKVLTDPHNPRTDITKDSLSGLVASIKVHSVKVPLIAYLCGEEVILTDGHRRLEAARIAGLREVPVIVLPNKPSEAEMLSAQLTINGHRQGLNPLDEYAAFMRLMQLKGYSPSDLAAALAIGGPEVTRVLSLGKLSPEEQRLVRDGKISKSAAYALSRMEPGERAAMLPKVVSGQITRDQLNSRARRPRSAETVKTKRVKFELGEVVCILQSRKPLSRDAIIEWHEESVREWRKGRSQGLDTSTIVAVLCDRNRQIATS